MNYSTAPVKRARSSGRDLALLALLVLALVAAACGSRRSEADLIAGAAGRPAPTGDTMLVDRAAGAGGDTDPGSDLDLDLDPVEGAPGDGLVAGPDPGPNGAGGAVPGAGADAAAPAGEGNGEAQQQRRAANLSPIRVGFVGTISGPAGASLGPLAQGVQVWARWINDRGGVNGHPVQVVVADDGGDPARHRALKQEFVEQRRVIAFIANAEALTGAGSVEYITSVGVPVVGSEGAGQWFYESPLYFPQASSGDALLQSALPVIGAYAAPRGITKAATITCLEVQVCRDAHESAGRGLGTVGLEVVYQAQASLGQPDFTSQCLQARNNDAQFLMIAMDANAVRSIAQACARQNYRPVIGVSAGQAINEFARDSNLEGLLVFSNVAPWPDSSNGATQEFQEAMATYAPGVTPTGGHMQGWVAAKVFELGTRELPADPKPSDVVEGLAKLNGDLLPELTGPLRFRPGQPALPTVCGFAVVVQDGRFVPAEGVGRQCAEFDPNL
jgi:branched-chain amino acid transport system substrate-binding protein